MRSKSAILTILGFAGFLFSCFTFFFTCNRSTPGVHEIIYDPTMVAREMLKEKKDSIKKEIETGNSVYATFQKTSKEGNPGVQKDIDSITFKLTGDSALLGKINAYYLEVYKDSSIAKKTGQQLRAGLNLDLLTEYDKLLASGKHDSISLAFSFYDAELKFGEVHKTVKLPVYRYSGDLDFFTKYPGFGFWALCIIIFGCCLFMSTGLSIDAGNELEKLMPASDCTGSITYWKAFALSFALLFAFAYTTYLTFYDGETIKDLYFMNDLQTKVKLLSIFGYAGAAFCFAGMISSASRAKCMKNKLDALSKEFQLQAEVTAIIEKLKTTIGVETDPAKKEEFIKLLEDNKTRLANSQTQTLTNTALNNLEQFRQLFKRFFYAISLLLALLVFCTGSLYSAAESLDFIKMIKDNMGFSPVRHDFVYLYSALHTLLILLFYLPAQLVINSCNPEMTTATGSTTERPAPGFLTGLKNQAKNMTNVLVASAPLVASFAQWFLNLVFGE